MGMFQLLTIKFCLMNGFWIMITILPAVEGGQLVNVALGKSTQQSSGGASGKVVDGRRDQNWYAYSCMATSTEYRPYWEVDLGDVYDIHSITIYNRNDCCGDRTRDIHTNVSIDGYVNTTACVYEGQIPDIYTCVPETRLIGRWVKIIRAAAGSGMMNFCEVEVMSYQRSGHFISEHSVVGTGAILQSSPVKDDVECMYLCFRTADCVSANLVNDTAGLDCQLLDSILNTTTTQDNISFWSLH